MMGGEDDGPTDFKHGPAMFRDLLDGTFEGILVHDDKILYANAAALNERRPL